jgi:hypothetical protein
LLPWLSVNLGVSVLGAFGWLFQNRIKGFPCGRVLG